MPADQTPQDAIDELCRGAAAAVDGSDMFNTLRGGAIDQIDLLIQHYREVGSTGPTPPPK